MESTRPVPPSAAAGAAPASGAAAASSSGNFIREIVARDVAVGVAPVLRFPPEPNGYPHLGHAKSICLNFGLARDFGGVCRLRYDDTNPETESEEYVRALEGAVRWLGFTPAEVVFTSDYFPQLHAWAVDLVERGLAYVDSESEDEIRAHRGTVTVAGTPSRFRDRTVDENLDLFARMSAGEFADGAHVLRARMDLAHPNMKLRDPVLYRIRRDAHHYRQGDRWNVYPLYDWAHGQSDAIEGVTHSLCTLEFDVNRPLYDAYLDALGFVDGAARTRPHQYEFARLNIDYTVMSKRKLLRLVDGGFVDGWDDPRMPTIAGQRRRGVPPEAIRAFCDSIGVSNVNGRVELSRYEHAIRDTLNATAPRVMGVARPLRLVLENVGEDETTWIDAPLWPYDVTPPDGAPLTRRVPLTRHLAIEADDYADTPVKGWHRFAPGASVRLRHAGVVTLTGVTHDADGAPVELRGTLDTSDDATARGVVHWVSLAHGVPARFRLIDRLFTTPDPEAVSDDDADTAGAEDNSAPAFLRHLNPDSLVETAGIVEPYVADGASDVRYQFERLGYFWPDPVLSPGSGLALNRIVTLRDGWARQAVTTQVSAAPVATPLTPAVAPRDPAAGLSGAERGWFEALVAQEVGEEEAAVLAADEALRHLHHDAVAVHADPPGLAILIVHDLRGALGGAPLATSKATARALGHLSRMIGAGTLTRSAARDVVAALVTDGGEAEAIVAAKGLTAVRDDDALGPIADAVIDAHPAEVARLRTGETKLLGFLTGQAMRRAGRGADAARLQDLLRARLGM